MGGTEEPKGLLCTMNNAPAAAPSSPACPCIRGGDECLRSALTSVSMDLAVVVLDELLDEGAVLVQDLVPHVGDVVEHRLIFHLDTHTHKWGRGRERRGVHGSCSPRAS